MYSTVHDKQLPQYHFKPIIIESCLSHSDVCNHLYQSSSQNMRQN